MIKRTRHSFGTLIPISAIVFVLVFILNSCEKVIDIPLVESERRIVVEAVLKDLVGESKVLLSKTGSMYDDTGFDKISGAIVTVKDEDDNEFTFTEDPLIQGLYKHPSFVTQPHTTYYLTVQAEGETITAESRSQDDPVIDSIYYVKQENLFAFAGGPDSIIVIKYNFQDDGSERNYYIRRGWQNNLQEFTAVFDDDYVNGQFVDATVSGISPEAGDKVSIELSEVDLANFKYQTTLNNTESTASPANPVSNIEGNALGYFGAYCVDTASVIIY